MKNPLLTTAEVAKLDGVSPRRILARIKQGHYPNAELKAGTWFIPAKDHKNAPHNPPHRPKKLA